MRIAPASRVAAVGLMIFCAGCTFDASGRGASDAGAQRENDCRPHLRGFTHLPSELTRQIRCYIVNVPENRSEPSGRAIGLRVLVLPALEPARPQEAVVYLGGGPGQAASVFLPHAAAADRPLRRRRDLVFADQRGTGGSHALDCQFYGPPENLQSYFEPFLPVARVRACRDALAKRADLAHYTTTASVADLEDIRRALAYERLNLIGSSYGTRLALEYLRRHDDRVRTVVLEGPVPPSLAIPEAFGRLAQRSLDRLLDECLQTPACAAAFPRIHEEARAVFTRLRSGSVHARVRHPVHHTEASITASRENVVEALRYMTYSARDAGRVPSYLHEAYRGNFSPLAQYLLARRASGTFDGLYLSVTCAEDVPFLDPAAAEADDETYLGGYRVREQRAACHEWPRGAVPASHRQPVSSERPVLIVSGMLDPVTTPEHGDEIARTLPNSRHLKVPHAGHSADGLKGLECVIRARHIFIEHGSLEPLDVNCVSTITRPGFALN